METKIGIEIFGGHASEGYKRCKSYLSRRWWWIRDREYYIWKDLKKGVWVLYGKKDGIYECLNVGKSINVGSEILYDIACLKFLGMDKISYFYKSHYVVATGTYGLYRNQMLCERTGTLLGNK